MHIHSMYIRRGHSGDYHNCPLYEKMLSETFQMLVQLIDIDPKLKSGLANDYCVRVVYNHHYGF